MEWGFAKGHGTGNDFVIIPDLEDRLALTAAQVAWLCDRRLGIGGDGLLRVVRRGGGWHMDYRNADGSVAETCGNGLRVFARYLVATGWQRTRRFPIGTRGGEVPVAVDGDAITVGMSVPELGRKSGAVLAGGVELAGLAVEVGNPHLVCAVPDLTGVNLSAPPRVDPAVFPDGANVELVSPLPEPDPGPGTDPADLPGADSVLRVGMRVFERGVGETRSCGSGACAAAAVALRDAGRPSGVVEVEVPGGRLRVDLDPEHCRLTGPAVLVATGTVALPDPSVDI